MADHQWSHDAQDAREGERPFALEAHSYSGGLRVEMLGRLAGRPGWAPPQDFVGFRNEFPLNTGDFAVEFARFRCRDRKVTWVGLFTHAVDEVYGDRQNHAGVGVWLLEHDVLHGGPLLHALRNFAEQVAQGRGAQLSEPAETFLAEYLPGYVVPSPALPPPLAGWAYAAAPLPQSAQFIAARADAAAAWELAAEQLLRCSVLPGPTPAHARALILVRAGAAASEGEATDAPPARSGSAVDLVKLLPRALAAVEEDGRSARIEAQQMAERCRGLEAELSAQRVRADQLAEAVPRLKAEADALRSELENSDPLQQWSATRARLADLTGQVQQTQRSIELAQRQILDRLPLPGQGARVPQAPAPAARDDERYRTAKASHKHGAGPKKHRLYLWGGIAAFVLLLLAVTAVTYWVFSRPEITAVSPSPWSEIGTADRR